MNKVLVVDDEEIIRRTFKEILEFENFEVHEASNGIEAWEKIQEIDYNLIFCDIKMPRMGGIQLLEKANELKPYIPFIIITSNATVDIAVNAIQKGAFDFITKPPDLNRVLVTLRNALEKEKLVKETKVLRRKVSKVRDILGESPEILRIKETIEKVAPTEARVLITGGNGTGKELVARWIHEKSERANGPFIEVNCAAIPSELIESELFGHEKGSFTSAIKQRIGKFEQANGGTLFLDEIGDMSHDAQAKVLRALQENKITRVGGEKDIKVDVRIVSATNKNLLDEVGKSNFRLDLYHRLSVILLHVPSLNNRRTDIPLLTGAFLKEICEDYGIPLKSIEPKAIDSLTKMNWTGNIRELRNIVERLVILSDKTIEEKDIRLYANPSE